MALIAAKHEPMEEAHYSERRFLAAGLAVSLLFHAVVAVALLVNVQFSVPEPPVEPIDVELVPAPEQETAKVQPPEPQQPEPESPEAVEEELPPEPAAPELPEPPEPEPAPADQAEAEEQPTEAEAPVMQPVEEFGEEDAAPQDAEEATAEPSGSEAETPTEEAAEDAQVSSEASAEVPEPEQPDEQDVAEAAPEEQDEPSENAERQPESGTVTGVDGAEEGADETAPAEDFGTVGPIVTAVGPSPKPARPPAPAEGEETGAAASGGGPAPGMIAARELFSDDILNDPRARTAMKGMPPGERLNLLCMTELRAQLTVTSPQAPELLPTFRPRDGNVLEPARAAFQSGGRWYDVAFRCEADRGVTKVESFNFRIGRAIPPSEWAERGLSGF